MANLSSCQGKLPQKWVHCHHAGFPACTSSPAIPQIHFDEIGRVLPKTRWNPFSQNGVKQISSSYYKEGKWSEKAEEEEGQVANMRNRNTTATKAVAGEPRLGTDLCYSQHLGTSMLVAGASDSSVPVLMQDLAYTGLTGLDGNVPTGRCCLRATDSLKVNSLKIILSGVMLLTAAVSWQPLHYKVQSWMGSPSKMDFVFKDMPVVDAASPLTPFSL